VIDGFPMNVDPGEVFTNEPHVPKAYRFLGGLMRRAGHSAESIVNAGAFADAQRRWDFFQYHKFAEEFVRNGAPTFVLSHSIAAALTATRAPKLTFSECPYSAFLIEVPSEFLPLPGDLIPRPKCWVSVLSTETLRAVSIHVKGCAALAQFQACDPERSRAFDDFIREEGLGKFSTPRADLFHMLLAVRIASNTTAFITAYKESVTRRVGTPSDVCLLDVTCPREVHVNRTFRDSVIALVGAKTIPRVRGVLAHLVRGHWRCLPSDGKRIWIAPYVRGDANIGRVVERTERL
jgi:hypothetical protein